MGPHNGAARNPRRVAEQFDAPPATPGDSGAPERLMSNSARHQKRDTKNRSWRREAGMALPWPISAHGDRWRGVAGLADLSAEIVPPDTWPPGAVKTADDSIWGLGGSDELIGGTGADGRRSRAPTPHLLAKKNSYHVLVDRDGKRGQASPNAGTRYRRPNYLRCSHSFRNATATANALKNAKMVANIG